MIFDNLTLLGLVVALVAGTIVVRAGIGSFHTGRRRKLR